MGLHTPARSRCMLKTFGPSPTRWRGHGTMTTPSSIGLLRAGTRRNHGGRLTCSAPTLHCHRQNISEPCGARLLILATSPQGRPLLRGEQNGHSATRPLAQPCTKFFMILKTNRVLTLSHLPRQTHAPVSFLGAVSLTSVSLSSSSSFTQFTAIIETTTSITL